LNGENIFSELIHTVRVCSLGEITKALYDVGGKYRRSVWCLYIISALTGSIWLAVGLYRFDLVRNYRLAARFTKDFLTLVQQINEYCKRSL